MDRPLDGVGLHDGGAGLIGEQVYRVRRMVPEQVIGPATGLAERVHVGAAKKVCLHVHLLDVEFASDDLPMHPLMAGIKSARMAAHRDQSSLLLCLDHRLRIAPGIGQRNLDLHVLAGLEACDGLRRVHLGRRTQDHRIDFAKREAVGEFGRDVRDAIFRRYLLGRLQPAADQ